MKKKYFLNFIIFTIIIYSSNLFSMKYLLPKEGRLIGENLYITIPYGNKLPLEYFSSKFKIGISNLLEANPDIDVFLPKGNTHMVIPKQLILPDIQREGIIINSAEMRLYFFPKGKNIVIILPIGIGEIGKDTPTNWVTSILEKKKNPTWTPTKSMRMEYASRGEIIPIVFPSGPDNPMGLYALYVGKLYAIHGTNANFGIGLRVSHGCIRLRSDDIKYLFDNVPIGTRVEFINEPVKISIEKNGKYYLEVHQPLSKSIKEFNSNQPIPICLPKNINLLLKDPSVNQQIVNLTLKKRSGIPINITNKFNKN